MKKTIKKLSNAAAFVVQKKGEYKTASTEQIARLNRIYGVVRTFVGVPRAQWASSVKVNKAFEIETKVSSRLTANNPKFIASLKVSSSDLADRYYPIKEGEQNQEKLMQRQLLEKDILSWPSVIQRYLNNAFALSDFSQAIRRGVKTLVRYGNVYGTIDYKRKIYRSKDNDEINETKGDLYPCLTTLSFTDVLVDPRYHQTQDSIGVIWRHENVRLSELISQKGVFNLDKITTNNNQPNSEKQWIYQIVIPGSGTYGEQQQKVKTLNVDKFFGYYSETGNPEDEAIWEIWVVNDCLVIKMEKITEISIISCVCFDDPEQHYGVGFLEPIIGLADEADFKRNAANDYINQSLYRSWIMSSTSGIDPKRLIGAPPNAIIMSSNPNIGDILTNHLVEVPHRQIDPAYFSNANEINRDIQSLSFTVDTTTTTSQQGFTNTATGQKIQAYETDTVYAEVLRHYEDFLVKLAYQMLEQLRKNMDDDIVVKYMGTKDKQLLKKIMLEEAPIRYDLQVEAGSSSYDSIGKKRDESLALLNVVSNLAKFGAQPNVKSLSEKVLTSFEGVDPNRVIQNDLPMLNSLMGLPSQTDGEVPPMTYPQEGFDKKEITDVLSENYSQSFPLES